MIEKPAPLVSVVMPVYNGERFLAEAIESILGQTFADFEFVIVDDGSLDGSAAIIRDNANRSERIRVVKHERNQGLTSARNSGIAASRGEFVAAMDHDDISLPRRIEKQAAFLKAHPEIGLVGTGYSSMYGHSETLKPHEMPLQHALILVQWTLGIYSVSGPTIMARRDTLNAVGGYDESIRASDDKELFSRLFWQTRFANLPDALYLHRRYDAQTSAMRRDIQKSESFAIRQGWLNHLWGKAPQSSIERWDRLRDGTKTGWVGRQLLRRDVARLVDAMVAAAMLNANDRCLFEAEMNRRLESMTPRRWQMFIHWWRHRFKARART